MECAILKGALAERESERDRSRVECGFRTQTGGIEPAREKERERE